MVYLFTHVFARVMVYLFIYLILVYIMIPSVSEFRARGLCLICPVTLNIDLFTMYRPYLVQSNPRSSKVRHA